MLIKTENSNKIARAKTWRQIWAQETQTPKSNPKKMMAKIMKGGLLLSLLATTNAFLPIGRSDCTM
jgi:hypothetical protein